MLAKLSNLLVADAMRIAGMQDLGPVTLLPLATGMAITVTLLALRAARPATARWSGALPPTTCSAWAFPAGPAQHHLLCFPCARTAWGHTRLLLSLLTCLHWRLQVGAVAPH